VNQPISLQEFANTGSILVGINPAFKTMVSVAIAHKMGLFDMFDPPEQLEQQEVLSSGHEEEQLTEESVPEPVPVPSPRRGRPPSAAKTPVGKKQKQ
jgi:hypothetical protein